MALALVERPTSEPPKLTLVQGGLGSDEVPRSDPAPQTVRSYPLQAYRELIRGNRSQEFGLHLLFSLGQKVEGVSVVEQKGHLTEHVAYVRGDQREPVVVFDSATGHNTKVEQPGYRGGVKLHDGLTGQESAILLGRY